MVGAAHALAQLDAGADPELGERIAQMGSHGVRGKVQLCGDVAVGRARRDDRRLPLRVDPLYWEAIDSWLEATARSMGALRWNSSAAITKCSLTMWRGETVYDVIGASKSTTPAGQRSDWDLKRCPTSRRPIEVGVENPSTHRN